MDDDDGDAVGDGHGDFDAGLCYGAVAKDDTDDVGDG